MSTHSHSHSQSHSSQSHSKYTPSAPPSSRHHPKHLLHVLRRANAHYSQLAASIRASLTPTHHARKRARALRLQVSTQAARKLEYAQVSVVPLPVLELGPEEGELGGKGGEEVAVERQEAREERIVAPIPRRATEMALKLLEEERAIRRAQRPVLRCAIPSVHVQPQDAVSGVSTASSVSLYSTLTVELTPASASALNTHAHADVNANYATDERSRWSCTTIDPQDSHEMAIAVAMVMDDDEEETQMEIEIPEVSIEHSPVDCTPEMMDLIPRARQHTYAHAHMHPVPVPTLPPTLDVPVDVAPLSWGSDIFSSSFSSSASSSSTTDSSSSSSGLLTPSDTSTSTEKLTITLRTKRKSAAFDREHEHDADAHADEVPERMVVEEKRPKYGRKEWVTPARRVYPRRF